MEADWEVVLEEDKDEEGEGEGECCLGVGRFFLAAAALALLRSRVPRPSALHRACSKAVSCSSFK